MTYDQIGISDPDSRCKATWDELNYDISSLNFKPFRDVWLDLYKHEDGFTFLSNTPGLDSCRPDRIFANDESIQTVDIQVTDGEEIIKQNGISPSSFKISDHKAIFAIVNISR